MADTKTERWTTKPMGAAIVVHSIEEGEICTCYGFKKGDPMETINPERAQKEADRIARALNTLADLEQVKSVGTANDTAVSTEGH